MVNVIEGKTKRCAKCKVVKALHNFGKCKREKDGLNYYCKPCARKASKKACRKLRSTPEGREKRNAANRKLRSTPEGREKAIAATRKTRSTPEGREKAIAAARKWAKENPEKACAFSAKRRSTKLIAVPLHFEEELVDKLYAFTKQEELDTGVDHDVDHIVALQGKNVSGLHCLANLQILTASANRSKYNSEDPDQDFYGDYLNMKMDLAYCGIDLDEVQAYAIRNNKNTVWYEKQQTFKEVK